MTLLFSALTTDISGRRRLRAAQKAGAKNVPVFINAVSRDEAAIMLVDSNLHREHILPSEKAFAYKLKLEALKHQGKTSTQLVSKLRSDEKVGSENDESRETSVRVKSGQQTSMENGVFYGNGTILGYRRVEKLLENNKKHVDFFIDPVQAETVKLIYEMYLEGHGLMQIKNELERRGYKTVTGKSRKKRNLMIG